MSTVIVRKVAGAEVEIGIGVMASTPPHIVIAWGEYADQGEADGDVRVIAAMDEGGNDIAAKVAEIVANAISVAIEQGDI